MKPEKELVHDAKRKTKPEDVLNLSFGTVFTDHMLMMDYSNDRWHSPRIVPYQQLTLDPAAMVLHYGQGIFEGMKAYRRGKSVYMFRPRKNMERMNASAKRMVMPEIDPDFVLDSIKQLLVVESDWIPQEMGSSLYIRPTLIGTESKLGVRPAKEYLFYVICCPVGPYFREGFNPVSIWVSSEHVRAVRGGVGAAKTMGNYAAALYAGQEAASAGYSQVLWLDALERKYIEEVGTMNIFIVIDNKLVTAPLKGTILPGITRDSVITLAKDWGISVEERQVSIDEVISGINSGRVSEIFGAGTAAIIAPVGSLFYEGKRYIVDEGNIGQTTQKLYDELTGIQCGQREDKYGWVTELKL